MATPQAREIYLCDLGDVNSGQIVGHEQGNTRPCIIIRPVLFQEIVIVIPTTSIPQKASPYSLYLEKGMGGLSKDSYALISQTRSISIERLIHKIGDLPEIDFIILKTMLLNLLEL